MIKTIYFQFSLNIAKTSFVIATPTLFKYTKKYIKRSMIYVIIYN